MNFGRITRLGLGGTMLALLVACAHPISMEATQMPERGTTGLVNKKVAYVISDADRAKEVTTAGGGGDKVKYLPYRDIEKSLRAALKAVFDDVVALKSTSDAKAIADSGPAYVFTPVINTTSSSSSAFTWPPTQFTVELVCPVTDAQGQPVTEVRAQGTGAAEFAEFKSDFSLSARRATADAAAKLVEQIRLNSKLK